MKLYIWNHPYSVPYGGSCAYAVAENVKAARELVKAARVNAYGLGTRRGSHQEVDVSRPPDAVHKLPYAEIYEWSE